MFLIIFREKKGNGTATYHLDDRDAENKCIEIPGFTSEISTNAQMVENDWNGTDTL